MAVLEKKVYYSTRRGEKALWDKYNSLDSEYNKTTLAMGVSDSIDSDLRENPEFMDLRVKAMYTIPNQKRELYQKLQNIIIIEDTEEYKNFDGTTVIMGSEVTLTINEKKGTYTIVGTDEGDLMNNILSENAPIVRAILGHKVGETVCFNGMNIEILNIEKAIF